MNSIKFWLRYPAVTIILTAMIVFVGVHAFLKMQRTEDPTITIRTGIVAAMYPGATSEQVEKQVTKTLEKHIFKFPEVRKEKTYSTSRPGVVIINVELEDNVKNSDQFWAKLRHEMNLTRATELPAGVMGPVVDSDFGDTVAMLVAVHGKRYGYRELRDFADKIHDEMRTVRMVGKIVTNGNQGEEIWITSSLERMTQYFADPRQMANALMQRNVIQSAGHFDADQSKIPIRTTGDLQHRRRNTERARRRFQGRPSAIHQRFRQRGAPLPGPDVHGALRRRPLPAPLRRDAEGEKHCRTG